MRVDRTRVHGELARHLLAQEECQMKLDYPLQPIVEEDVYGMLAEMDAFETGVPCWKWRDWTFSQEDKIRLHALGVSLA